MNPLPNKNLMQNIYNIFILFLPWELASQRSNPVRREARPTDASATVRWESVHGSILKKNIDDIFHSILNKYT